MRWFSFGACLCVAKYGPTTMMSWKWDKIKFYNFFYLFFSAFLCMVYFAMWDSFHSDSLTYHHHRASPQQGSQGEKLWKRKQALNWRHNKQNCALPLVKEERRIEELRQQTGYICSRWVFGSTCALSFASQQDVFRPLTQHQSTDQRPQAPESD